MSTELASPSPSMSEGAVTPALAHVALLMTTGLQLPVSTPPAANVLTLVNVRLVVPCAMALNWTCATTWGVELTDGPAGTPVE